MKLTGKIIMLAAGTAVLSSAVTAIAMKRTPFGDNYEAARSYTELFDQSGVQGGGVTRVAQLPANHSDFTTAAESTINGVVSIKSYATPRGYSQGGNSGGYFNDPFFDFFFGNPNGGSRRSQPRQQEQHEQRQQPSGLGSGVIISADGYIVTNNHVIDDADRLEVTLNDNRTFDATVVGADATTDLALIKIDATDLPVIPMGDSEALKVGEWVLAVGNPFGFTSTVTTGIVSAKSRSIGGHNNGRMGIESYIQTDAAVNPGNSGGALVNLAGELIGINTAIYSQTGNYAGYSFAVPTSIVKKVMSDLRQYGTVQRAVLGVSISDLSNEIAKEKGITAVTKGVYVGEVSDRSSAMEAGLKKNDVIVKINDTPTDNVAQLQEQVAKYRPGDKIKVTYVRDNKTQSVDVTLRNPQGNMQVTKAGDFTDLGCAFKKVDEATLRQLGLSNGVQVTALSKGRFSDSGVKQGFIVYSINDSRVSSPDDVEKIYKAIMKGSGDEKVMILRGVYPTGKRGIYAVDLTGVE
ncbi:MAG: Do family serine endopeptidase [Duncaniella sp.]|uniref:Do family serine endopeptidase n=1 Tax=Duncaniella sp. TaxID=2518496 RepID=UPI0023C67299|nr:Do family serine endopeptidase [Duncaniella sp.]MDE6089317.1 Do family serine endopeptidase [Duncaniella sp.]